MQGYIKLVDLRFKQDPSFRFVEAITNFLIRHYFKQLRITIINLFIKLVNKTLAEVIRIKKTNS
jgi:hypothetical protein